MPFQIHQGSQSSQNASRLKKHQRGCVPVDLFNEPVPKFAKIDQEGGHLENTQDERNWKVEAVNRKSDG